MKWRIYRTFISAGLVIMFLFASYIVKDKSSIAVSGNVTNMPVYSVEREDKVASITFDVNWAETDYLNSILETLDKYNVKATFFVMGGWVNYSKENLEKLKVMHERGHEIGNHSYIHPSFTSITKERMLEEVSKTDKIIEEVTGEKTKLFRFPSGDYNQESTKVIEEAGYIAIQWNADSVDWKEAGEDIEYNKVTKKIHPGSILLFHNNAKYTPKNLDKLLKEFSEQGYKFIPVGELIYKENYYVDNSGNQIRK